MERTEIFNKLKDIIKQANVNNTLQDEDYREDLDLRSDLGLSSIGVLYVAIALEETFQMEFNGTSFDDFHTVKDVIDYIMDKTN